MFLVCSMVHPSVGFHKSPIWPLMHSLSSWSSSSNLTLNWIIWFSSSLPDVVFSHEGQKKFHFVLIWPKYLPPHICCVICKDSNATSFSLVQILYRHASLTSGCWMLENESGTCVIIDLWFNNYLTTLGPGTIGMLSPNCEVIFYYK